MATIASVALQNVTYHIDKLYDYSVPSVLQEEIAVGCRVIVPFGKISSEREGVVLALRQEEEINTALKDISAVLTKAPLFTSKMIGLAEYMKDHTFCTMYDALKTMLPGGKHLSDKSVKMCMISEHAEDRLLEGVKLTRKQREVYEELSRIGTCSVSELCYFTGVTVGVVNALAKKNLIEFYDKEVFRTPYEKPRTFDESEIILTDEQQMAYCNLISQYQNGGGVSLLYGVTGSGKTSVYLRLIDEVSKSGRGVIVMVPEIALTPQTLRLFKERYGTSVAVFHSALSNGERYDEWKRVKQGFAKIVVGTRSAVFAPFENLGLIIMDEEQEHTYKSEQSPRYHARNIAKYRCAEDNALLVLASATPSFESYTAAINGKYTLNVLSSRFGNAILPSVEVIDMGKERHDGNKSEISRRLLSELMKNQDEGHQSIILLNRRGYNTFVACNSCGSVETCPNCSISLTYHRANDRLMCHYCGYSVPFTTKCSSCGEHDVRYSGAGTQRFEEEISKLLPSARILRMDADTTMQKYSYEEKLNAFRQGEYDIMIGTQMVAKGLDFENVTLVGVLSADSSLYNDDYKSMETTFDLLTQVVGRAGRGKYKGRAIIQTVSPENEVIKLASQQDYENFYNMEINLRRAMVYPPYCNLCTLNFQSQKEEKVAASAVWFMEQLKETAAKNYPDVKIIVLGPMPERVYKVSNKYRYRIIIKCKNNKRFREMLSELIIKFGQYGKNSGVSIVPDFE